MHAAATGRVSKGGPEGPEGPEGSLPNMLGRRPDGAALGGHGPARPAHACTCIRRLLPHRDHGDDPFEAHCPAKVTSARALPFPVPNRFQPAFSLNHPVNKYPLRRVAYQDPVTKNRYVFVTNNTTWVAQTIADIYKSRWQIELFFKWIKQHLKVKRFVGRSKNAVMTQLWVAMCMYLLLAYLKFVMRLRWSLHQMLQVLQLNMFERRPLQDLFTTPSLPAPSGSQLSLAWS